MKQACNLNKATFTRLTSELVSLVNWTGAVVSNVIASSFIFPVAFGLRKTDKIQTFESSMWQIFKLWDKSLFPLSLDLDELTFPEEVKNKKSSLPRDKRRWLKTEFWAVGRNIYRERTWISNMLLWISFFSRIRKYFLNKKSHFHDLPEGKNEIAQQLFINWDFKSIYHSISISYFYSG